MVKFFLIGVLTTVVAVGLLVMIDVVGPLAIDFEKFVLLVRLDLCHAHFLVAV